MPYPAYHLGPSGFFGLALRKWIDIPVFVLANVIVDLEVLFAPKWPIHQYWHFHSLLIGGVAGAIWGIIAYKFKPLKWLFEWGMRLIRLPYKTNLWKTVISGVLGVWLHVVLDAVYHYDVLLFWPIKAKQLQRPLWRLVTQEQEKAICIGFWIAGIILYVLAVRSFNKPRNGRKVKSPK